MNAVRELTPGGEARQALPRRPTSKPALLRCPNRTATAPAVQVLLIRHWFPPTNVIGAVRAGKFAKFLHEAGHDLRVLAGPALEPTPLSLEVPDAWPTGTGWLHRQGQGGDLGALLCSPLHPRPENRPPALHLGWRSCATPGPETPTTPPRRGGGRSTGSWSGSRCELPPGLWRFPRGCANARRAATRGRYGPSSTATRRKISNRPSNQPRRPASRSSILRRYMSVPGPNPAVRRHRPAWRTPQPDRRPTLPLAGPGHGRDSAASARGKTGPQPHRAVQWA